MPRDRVLVASNHIAAEWDKKTRELKKQERRRKQHGIEERLQAVTMMMMVMR